MNMFDDDPQYKKVRELIRKQDPTINISFYPQQLIIGNFSPRLVKDYPLFFQHNKSSLQRRLATRFKVEGNPLIGYPANDLGVALTQLESISVKDEFGDNLPAMVMTFRQHCVEKIWKIMPGLQEQCSKAYAGEGRSLARNFTFILNSFPTLPDVFCKIVFLNELGKTQEFHFDFDVSKVILLRDIQAVWMEMTNAQLHRRANVHLNRTHDLMREMSNHSWVEYLTHQKLIKTTSATGETMYIPMDQHPSGRRMMPRGGRGDSQFKPPNATAIRHERRSVEALKMVKKSYGQRREGTKVFEKEIRLREDWIQPIRSKKRHRQKENGTRAKANFKSSKKNALQPIQPTIPPPLDHRSLSHITYADLETDQYNQYTYTDNQPYQYPDNSYQPVPYQQNSSSVDYVADRLRHLGQESEDVEMAPTGMIPGGDYQYPYQYDQYQNGQQEYWNTPMDVPPESVTSSVQVAPESASEVPTTNSAEMETDAEMMKFFFIPKQQGDGPAPAATPAQISPQKKVVVNDKAVPRTRERDGDQKTVPERQVKKTSAPVKPAPRQTPPTMGRERISAETELFTFPPRHLAVDGIDPVVLFAKDVKTLDRKEFVNDNVMAFMLNYISVYMIDKKLMEKIVMNNTFFYSNLTRNIPVLTFNGRRGIDPTAHAQLVYNCSRVFRWTRKFDVFKKDYIVIPINEDFHWLLVTVFNPAGAIVDMSDEAASRAKPKCYVAFFDPLSGLDPVKRNHMCHCVTTYLRELYQATKTTGKKFEEEHETKYDEDRVIVTRPVNTPIQNNFFDCGLYTLYFIEGLFCYLNRPVTVNDFPNFDWSKLYPKANEMADLMRDKIYNVIQAVGGGPARSRLARFEKINRHGLSQEGALRRSRRHSAFERRIPTHPDLRPRRYSVNPPGGRNVMDDPIFYSPRDMAEMPCTQRVRALKWPEENFPVIY